MPFFALIPLFLIWAVVSALLRAEHVKKQQAAKRNAEQFRGEPEQPASRGSDGQLRPVRPSVQVPPQAQSPRTPVSATRQTKPEARKTPGEPAAVKRPSAPPAPALDPEPLHQPVPAVSTQAASPLSFEPQSILQGVLFAEIFGKPKALR
jgi:hypothetical protein